MIIHRSTEQNSEQWDNWRAPRITASEVSKIITGSGKESSQREAYLRRCAISRKYDLPSNFKGNEHTDRGHALEPIARERFVETYCVEVEEVACIEHDNGLCGGSPDGIIMSDGRIVSGIEIKCLKYENHIDAYMSLLNGVLPTKYKAQVHALLWLSGAVSWQFMVYRDDALPFEFKVLEVTPDDYTEKVGEAILTACQDLEDNASKWLEEFEESLRPQSLTLAMPTLAEQLTNQESLC